MNVTTRPAILDIARIREDFPILRLNGIHNVSDGRHRIAFGGISAILAMRVMY